MAAPHREGISQNRGRGLWLLSDEGQGRSHACFESVRVYAGSIDGQDISAGVASDDVSEITADRGDVGLHRVTRPYGGLLAVDAVDDAVDADRSSCVGEKDRQDAPLFWTPHRD